MGKYNINKGIGKPPEFKGLTAQYLFIFAGGLLSVFILFVIMYLAGVPTSICIIIGISIASALVFYVFRMNEKYGQYGLMKKMAIKKHPRFIINRKNPIRLFTSQK